MFTPTPIHLRQVPEQLAVLLRARGSGEHHVGIQSEPGLVEVRQSREILQHNKYRAPAIIRHEPRDSPNGSVLDLLEMRRRLGGLNDRR